MTTQKRASLAILLLLSGLTACIGEEAGELPNAELADEVYEEGPPFITKNGKSDIFDQDLAAYGPLPKGMRYDLAIQAVFAPDDPVATLEMHMIDRVRDARRADATVYGAGENPYRIRYAVYNLRNPDLLDRLVDAHKAGVDVRVLIEAAQIDPDKPWNIADKVLVDNGFTLFADHRKMTDADKQKSATLVGIKSGGLMHLKTRIYDTPEGSHLLTGSLNPGDNAVLNEESLHLISDARIIERYREMYDNVLYGRPIANKWEGDKALNVLFTPTKTGVRAGTQILRWIEEEQEQILIMVFSLRELTADNIDGSLVDILAQKVKDGVPVYVITDRKQSDGIDADGNRIMWDDVTEDKLRRAGVPVYEAVNYATPFCAMHFKAAVLGKTRIRVITDAANWTLAGLGGKGRATKNVESVLFIDSARLDDNLTGRRYLAQWTRVLSRYAHQSVEIDREKSFDAVYERLSSAANWPSQPVSFGASHAETAFGESIKVIGDRPELGAWGNGHNGVALTTDAASYPRWSSLGPVLMPLGAQFEWKFVAQHQNTLRWEPGENRQGIAQPSALTGAADAHYTDAWR
ncbi:MAG: hypothetical protein H0U74_18280 [Bradymonadaceae bacterium]|nr:hypothetical protein [Lujinxingiaceae bacterium]